MSVDPYLNVVGIGDSAAYLRQLPDSCIDSVVTDAPYGLGDQPDPIAVMLAWARGMDFDPSGKGFMGKKWDAFVPQPSMWREVFRVLKPGGHLLSFFGTRTFDWGVMAIRFANFEIHDQLDWLYGSGFPAKSRNISKDIDKVLGAEREVVGKHEHHGLLMMKKQQGAQQVETDEFDILSDEAVTPEAEAWQGWGTALKPAHEPIVLARRPLEERNFAENVLKHGTGGLNIDACRLSGKSGGPGSTPESSVEGQRRSMSGAMDRVDYDGSRGRWPTNVMLSHSPECELVGTRRVRTGTAVQRNIPDEGGQPGRVTIKPGTRRGPDQGYGDEDGKEEIEDWNCADGCPVAALDQQSGTSKSSDGEFTITRRRTSTGLVKGQGTAGRSTTFRGYGDEGGASRFFYQPKASTKERWAYCKRCKLAFCQTEWASHKDHEDDVIAHPTQKPLALMRYLVQLVTQEGGVVLDPYCGTGTTAVAAKQLGLSFVTCELDPDYAKIAQARLALVGRQAKGRLQSGAYFCPGCKAKGIITLLSRASVERMRESGKKNTCMKCMKRYSFEELTG